MEAYYNYNEIIENYFLPFINGLNINYKIDTNSEIDNVYVFEDKNVAIEIIPLHSLIKSDYIRNKNKFYNSQGIHLLSFYEDEFTNEIDICKSKIKQILKLNNDLIKINTRECIIREVTAEEKNNFLNLNHIQGTDLSKIYVGAFYNDKLTALMTFIKKDGKSMNGFSAEKNTYELSRFCTAIGYSVSGMFNRLLKNFIKNYEVLKIRSFADLRFSLRENNIYLKNGFKEVKVLQSKYSYVDIEDFDDIDRHNRFSFGKKYLKKDFPEIYNDNLTEREITKLAGYEQIFDGGIIKYELEVNENKEIKGSFGYIYKITNTLNQKVYIGQTLRHYTIRFNEYTKLDSKINIHLKNAFNKYGINNFKFEVIDDNCKNIDELNQKEIYYINFYDSCNSINGYNLEIGGRNSTPSNETKLKMSLAGKGKKQTKEHVEKRFPKDADMSKHGRNKTDEEKEYLSEILKGENSPLFGIKRTDEVKKKVSETKIANGSTQKVSMWDVTTREIVKSFNSISEAHKITKICESTIRLHCKQEIKNIMIKYFFSYQGVTPNFDNMIIKYSYYKTIPDTLNKVVEKYNLKTNEILETYETITEASKLLNISWKTINKHCRGEVIIYQFDYSFRFRDYNVPKKELKPIVNNGKEVKVLIVFDHTNNNEIIFTGSSKEVKQFFSDNNIDVSEHTIYDYITKFPNKTIGINKKYIICKLDDFEKNNGYVKPKIERPGIGKEILADFSYLTN